MAHIVQIKELINGIQITETVDSEIVIKLLSYQGKPFFRTTNETDEETYQIIDKVGEIYNLPALATEFVLIDLNENVYIPADGEELIEYSVKLRPFRADTERDEAHTGTIETTANSVTINLPGDGVNWAKIDGSFYERYYPDTFNFAPVTTDQKILIIYAKPDAQVFYLAQGIEAPEAVEPDYDGLFVARILVSSTGQIVETEDNGFKVRSEDSWRTIPNTTPAFISLGNNPAGSFHLTGTADVLGFVTKQGKYMWPGRKFFFKTDQAVTLKASTFTDTTNAKHWTFAVDYELKADSWAILKEKAGEILLVKMGGGGTTGDYIPLTGTEEGKPVTGPIESNAVNGMVTVNGPLRIGSGESLDLENANRKSETAYYSDENGSELLFTAVDSNGETSGIQFISKNLDELYQANLMLPSTSKGLDAQLYYGANYTDYTYVQKKYVDQANSYSTTEIKTGGTWIDGKPIYTITQLTTEPIPADIETRFPDVIIGDYTVYKFTKTTD